MSVFERFMLWIGFVSTKRVLSGISGIKETAWRVSVGYEIFGRRYSDLEMRRLLKPWCSTFEEAALVFSSLGEAMKKIDSPCINPKKTTSGINKNDW